MRLTGREQERVHVVLVMRSRVTGSSIVAGSCSYLLALAFIHLTLTSYLSGDTLDVDALILRVSIAIEVPIFATLLRVIRAVRQRRILGLLGDGR